MAKRVIKNILLTFVIVYTILSLIGFIIMEIEMHKVLYETVYKMQTENKTMELYGEKEIIAENEIENKKDTFKDEKSNVPLPVTEIDMLHMMYIMGMNYIIEIQLFILICSLGLSIVIGIIISLEEKSRAKHVLFFLLLGFVLNALWAFKIGILKESFFESFFENFLDSIRYGGIYYIIVYIILYLGEYFRNKKRANKLNEALKNKKK